MQRFHPATSKQTGWRLFAILLFALLCLIQVVHAAAFAPPTGRVLLILDGNIKETNVGDELHLDMEALRALPSLSFDMQTPWSEERWVKYQGVNLKELLRQADAGSDEFTAVGVDDYSARFQDVDLEKYPVMIAYTENGKPMSLRKLGPLRIMFSFSDFPQFNSDSSQVMAVWQLIRMSVH